MKEKGCFVISLDFELLWGAINSWTPDGYGQTHIKQVSIVIKRLVDLFEKYNVKATFAIVGFVMLHDVEDLKKHKPSILPTYSNKSLCPYGDYLDKVVRHNKKLCFAPELVEMLKKSANIEIGTHTFSHYYCWEEGQTTKQFEEDIAMAQKVAEEHHLRLNSIVFPRNQVSKDYLSVCAKYGITTYRGNPKKYFQKPTSKKKERYYRLARLLDAYINWGGYSCHPYYSIDMDDTPMNVPASRMLRPYIKKLCLFEKLRLRRIKKEMLYAANHHELYHLWWHPHNFGANMEKNFAFLEEILKYYQYCQAKADMESMSMNEFYQYLKKLKRHGS